MKPCQPLYCHSEERGQQSERRRIPLFSAIIIAVFGFCFFGTDLVFAASNTTLDFDGVDNYVVADDNSVFDQANRLSISVWIQPDNTPGGDEYIVYRYNDYYLKIDSNRKIIGSVHTDAETVTSVSAITADGARWTHIEMTYDKDIGGVDELKLYIDGALSGVGDYSTANAVSAELLYVGAADLDGDGGGNTPVNFFDGKIDDVRLYQYARSLTDVQMDFNDGLAVRLGGSSVIASEARQSLCDTDPASCISHGLVASYDFNEGDGQTLYNAADTGSANDGTLGSSAGSDVNDPTWRGLTPELRGQTPNGPSGSSLQFDGTDDYIDCGNDSSLDITDAITIEAWVKSTTPGYHYIVNKNGKTKGYNIYCYDDSNSFRGGIDDGTNSQRLIYNTNLFDGNWHHLVMTAVPGDIVYLYYDGNRVAEGDASAVGDISNSEIFEIGSSQQGIDYYFNGSIDGVKIYNRACSAEEVRYHYNRGGPVAHWRMDEGEGSVVYDETSNNNDGALHLGSSGNTATSSAWVAGNPSTSSGQVSATGSGSAISFDGTDDYIDCGSDSSLKITGAMSITAWFKADAFTGEPALISYWDSNGNQRAWRILFVNSKIYCPFFDESINAQIGRYYDTVLNTGQWYNVVCTYDGGTSSSGIKIYLDGVRVDDNDNNANTFVGVESVATNIRIGKVYDTNFFNGKIDDVRIYNYARTPAQILMDYNAGFAAHLK